MDAGFVVRSVVVLLVLLGSFEKVRLEAKWMEYSNLIVRNQFVAD